jgi:hypothetical protein
MPTTEAMKHDTKGLPSILRALHLDAHSAGWAEEAREAFAGVRLADVSRALWRPGPLRASGRSSEHHDIVFWNPSVAHGLDSRTSRCAVRLSAPAQAGARGRCGTKGRIDSGLLDAAEPRSTHIGRVGSTTRSLAASSSLARGFSSGVAQRLGRKVVMVVYMGTNTKKK